MTAPRRLYSLDELEAMLKTRARDLAMQLAPGGHLEHNDYVALNPTRNDRTKGSFRINLQRGYFKDFAADDCQGGMLALIALCATGGRYKSEDGRPGAIEWAKRYLGLDDRPLTPAEVSNMTREHDARRARDDAEEAKKAEARRKMAHRLWLSGRHLDGSDPASLYLKGRGIDVTALSEGPPACLRVLTDCEYRHRDGATTKTPALLAAMSLEGVPHGFAAVHRTYIAERGGQWVKAFGRESKRILGAKMGATIRLTKGASGYALGRMIDGEWIAIAEGIENALSAAIVKPGLRMLAAGTLENIGHAVLPAHLGGVFLIADNDLPGSKAEDALERAANKLALERNIEIKIVRAPKGFKDFNDALCNKRLAG